MLKMMTKMSRVHTVKWFDSSVGRPSFLLVVVSFYFDDDDNDNDDSSPLVPKMRTHTVFNHNARSTNNTHNENKNNNYNSVLW